MEALVVGLVVALVSFLLHVWWDIKKGKTFEGPRGEFASSADGLNRSRGNEGLHPQEPRKE